MVSNAQRSVILKAFVTLDNFSSNCLTILLRHNATTENFVAALRSSRTDFYFWQRLRQQRNCEGCAWQGMLHWAIFRATCVATKLRDKLHEKLRSVMGRIEWFMNFPLGHSYITASVFQREVECSLIMPEETIHML